MFVLTRVPPNNPISARGATSFPGYHSFPKWTLAFLPTPCFSDFFSFKQNSAARFIIKYVKLLKNPLETHKKYGTIKKLYARAGKGCSLGKTLYSHSASLH